MRGQLRKSVGEFMDIIEEMEKPPVASIADELGVDRLQLEA